MSMNGKREEFAMGDFQACAKTALMKRGRADTIVDEVRSAVQKWPEYAAEAGVAEPWQETIRQTHRLEFSDR
jgi:serine/threonine-protein kinase HipA